MNRVKAAAGLLILALVVILGAGCSQPGLSAPAETTPEVYKPRPVVESTNASTSGMLDNYYAIMDISVKNDGADGTVVVTGFVTQGGQTIANSLPVYVSHNSKQVVRLVLPLRWNGGDWTPRAEVQVP